MYGYIYKITNLINNKIYIGQHKADKYEPEKYFGSGTALGLAIKKYGITNFKQELVKEYNTKEELDTAEIFWISAFNTADPNFGYNLTNGGSGGCIFRSEETKEKIKHWNTNKIIVNNGETSIKIDKTNLSTYINNGWKKGVLPFNRTEEDKLNHSKAQTGKIAMSKDNIKTWVDADKVEEFLSNGFIKGWKQKETNKKAIGNTKPFKWMNKDNSYKKVSIDFWDQFLKDGWAFGGYKRQVKNRKGFIPTEETRKKLSESHKGHHNSPESIKKQADKLKGRIIVHKDNIIKYIYKEELENYLNKGFILGRK